MTDPPPSGARISEANKFVRLAAEADNAVLKTLESRTLANGLAELRVMHADR
jgi:hypothetical protein